MTWSRRTGAFGPRSRSSPRRGATSAWSTACAATLRFWKHEGTETRRSISSSARWRSGGGRCPRLRRTTFAPAGACPDGGHYLVLAAYSLCYDHAAADSLTLPVVCRLDLEMRQG